MVKFFFVQQFVYGITVFIFKAEFRDLETPIFIITLNILQKCYRILSSYIFLLETAINVFGTKTKKNKIGQLVLEACFFLNIFIFMFFCRTIKILDELRIHQVTRHSEIPCFDCLWNGYVSVRFCFIFFLRISSGSFPKICSKNCKKLLEFS